MKNLKKSELIIINGGGDSCPMQKDRGLGYYIGYLCAWFVETAHVSVKI